MSSSDLIYFWYLYVLYQTLSLISSITKIIILRLKHYSSPFRGRTVRETSQRDKIFDLFHYYWNRKFCRYLFISNKSPHYVDTILNDNRLMLVSDMSKIDNTTGHKRIIFSVECAVRRFYWTLKPLTEYFYWWFLVYCKQITWKLQPYKLWMFERLLESSVKATAFTAGPPHH